MIPRLTVFVLLLAVVAGPTFGQSKRPQKKKVQTSQPADIWDKRAETMQFGGLDLFYSFYFSRNDFIRQQYPQLGSLGGNFLFPIWHLFGIYNKFTYYGLFNNDMATLPKDYISASINMIYFSQGPRVHLLFGDLLGIDWLRHTLDLYIQGGWLVCRLTEQAANKEINSVYAYNSMGYELGGGVKIMVTNNIGFLGECMMDVNKAGKNQEDITSLQVNVGLFIGFIGDWMQPTPAASEKKVTAERSCPVCIDC